MSDKERIQINVNLSPGQKQQLDVLALHYGSVTAAVRVALDALWREHIRGRDELASIEDDTIHEDSDAGRSPV
jgi:hypothetical protein